MKLCLNEVTFFFSPFSINTVLLKAMHVTDKFLQPNKSSDHNFQHPTSDIYESSAADNNI